MPARKNARRKIFGFFVPKRWDELLASLKGIGFFKQKKNVIFFLLPLLILAVATLGYLFKDKFVVAIVEGKPIFRYQLNSRLTQTYGKDTLENMIIEELIRNEANRKGVAVSEEEINSEIKKVETSLGSDLKLEDALKFQGLTLAEFRNQITLKLQVNKILDKEISISSDEVAKYVKDNAELLVATAEAEKTIEAEQKLKEQKISERIQSWVNELLAKAKITRFLQ